MSAITVWGSGRSAVLGHTIDLTVLGSRGQQQDRSLDEVDLIGERRDRRAAGLSSQGPANAVGGADAMVEGPLASEVANGLRRRVAAQQLGADAGWTALDAFRRLGMTRYPVFSLLDRVWELRDNLSAYDASNVALAELLDCNLLTADARLSRAPGIRCPITVVPR